MNYHKENLGRQDNLKSLLVVDDHKIRQGYFKKSKSVLKKIDKLEEDLKSFYEKDQRLYQQWYQLTFQEDLEKLQLQNEEYDFLGRFHNWVIITAKYLVIDITEAYAKMKLEQQRWENASDDIRRQIDDDRRKRDDLIKEEIRNDYENAESFDEEVKSFNQEDHPDDLREPELDTNTESEYVDEELENARELADIEHTSELSIKTIYRILVRQLHPDLQEKRDWTDRYWEKLQWAYKNKSMSELKKLRLLIILRSGKLNEISVQESAEVEKLLEYDLQNLKQSIGRIKKSPAWRFGKRFDYAPLANRAKKDLDRQIANLEKDLLRLKNTHAYWNAIYNSNLKSRLEERRSTSRRKPKANRGDPTHQTSFFD